MIEKNRKRRPNFNLKKETIENILKHRARGYTLDSIAKIFGLGSRQKAYIIIKENKNVPEFSNLYKEINITEDFLKRKL